MSASLLNQQKLFGLFELDALGTALYSRIEPDDVSHETAPNVAARNFYKEVAPFANAEDFRQRVSNFAHGEGQADSFYFICLCDDESLPVKVLLARIRESFSGKRAKSILVHIRKAQPDAH